MSIIKTKRKEKIAELEKNISSSKSLLVNPVMMDKSFDSNGSNSVGIIMMPELIKDNSIIFNFEHKDKGANMGSFIVTQVSPEIFEVINKNNIPVNNLSDFLSNSNSKSLIFMSQFIKNISQIWSDDELKSHFKPISSSNSFKVIGFILPDLSFLELSSIDLTTSLTTDSLTSLSSYSDISDISLAFFINASSLASINVLENACLATDDQLIQSSLPIFSFNLSGTDSVIVPMLDLQSHKNPYGFLGHQKAMPSECNYLYYVYTKDIFKSFGFNSEQKESSKLKTNKIKLKIIDEIDKKTKKQKKNEKMIKAWDKIIDEYINYNPSSLINSAVVNTLTEDCSFRALSSDHNGMFLESESAIKGASSGCETSFNANLMNFLNSSSGTMFILDSKNMINIENSYLFMPDLEIISCLCSKDSEIICSGAYNTSFEEQINSLDFDCLIKADIKALVSTATSNYTNSLYRFFHIDNLIFLPSFKASCSVSLLLDVIASNNSICDAFSLNACRATSDQLISKCLFITTFNSFGTDKVMLTILNTPDMCDMCNNVQIYKTSDFVKESEAMNLSEYAFDSELSEMFFVNASNNVSISQQHIKKEGCHKKNNPA